MNVVVTGAAGFVGSHLVDRYLRDGAEVLGIDSLLTGSEDNLRGACKNPRFRFVRGDVASGDPQLMQPDGGAELVLHFASPASPVDYATNPFKTLAVNSRGTEACCLAALAMKARLVYASTSEVYGDPLQHPQAESYWGNVNPLGPRSCYDESKRFGEALVMAYVRERGLDARIVRIFNTYGPRMRRKDGRVVPTFIDQALRAEPLTIQGDGSQTRSYCYIDDLVEGVVRCAASELTSGIAVNLGNPDERNVRELAEIVSRLAGVPLKVVNKPLPLDDPARRCPDISRARELLGWEPHVSLEDGLRATIAFTKGQTKVWHTT
ncbi:MAG TPA: NAD-dependent epimerase/dehydratase family protein [Candidatus Tumulicola sp.]|nr:NAD-dependent epimerase/dehydratase family protein [Candidatus Tumulicola sp.]